MADHPGLWPHQKRARVEASQAAARGHRHQLVVMPTGSGKTILGRSWGLDALAQGVTGLWLGHREELLDQPWRAFREAGVPADQLAILKGDRAVNPNARFTFASTQTLATRARKALAEGRPLAEVLPSARFVVVDEAHHYAADDWSVVASFLKTAFIVGLTATPVRSDGRALGDIFDHLIVGATVRELTAAGVLCPADVIAPPRPQSELSMPVTEAVKKHGVGGPTVVFVPTVSQARAIAEQLGPRAGWAAGESKPSERKAVLEAFEAGALDVLVNAMLWTEGWDSKRLNACAKRSLVIARGCSSWSTWRQIVGRGIRQAPGVSARCTVVDLRGAVHVHGLPDEDVEFSLEGDPVRRKTAALPAVAHCKHCWWTGTPPRDRCCPRCGARFPAPEPPKVKETAMARIDATATQEQKQIYFNVLIEKATAKGYKAGYVGAVFRARFGYWPNGFRYTGPKQLDLLRPQDGAR